MTEVADREIEVSVVLPCLNEEATLSKCIRAANAALDEAVISGEAALASNGEPWGGVRYWLAPKPGYGLAEGSLEALAAGLLRGGPALP